MVSYVVRQPGPTGSIFDVLAACVATLCPGPRFALLGFAAGGIVPPLRALGFNSPIEAVDVSLDGEKVFRRAVTFPHHDVHVTQDDAASWLKRIRRRFDLILDDLSVLHTDYGVVKPKVSLTILPTLVANRLSESGIGVFNAVPSPDRSLLKLLSGFASPFRKTLVLSLDDYENRLVIAGRDLPGARCLSQELRLQLRTLGSKQATRFSIRKFR